MLGSTIFLSVNLFFFLNIEQTKSACRHISLLPASPLVIARGCYNSGFMGPLVFSQRSMLRWNDYENFVIGLVNKCVDSARNQSHNFFGIEFYAECFTASNVDLATKTPNASSFCYDYRVGEGHQVFVYEIIY